MLLCGGGAGRETDLKYTPLLSSSFGQLDWHGVKVRAAIADNCTSIGAEPDSRLAGARRRARTLDCTSRRP
jgi:hypothetical protein